MGGAWTPNNVVVDPLKRFWYPPISPETETGASNGCSSVHAKLPIGAHVMGLCNGFNALNTTLLVAGDDGEKKVYCLLTKLTLYNDRPWPW